MSAVRMLKMFVAIGALGALAQGAPAFAETMGPVTDEIGVLKIPKGAPIYIGGYWTISGPDVTMGIDQQRGAEIALDDWGNKVAGHPIKFLVEDSQCSAEGGQAAGTKLASNQNVVLVLGPDCSSAATAAAPILWNVGIPSVGTSTTAPALTASDRKPGLDGFIRTVPNDLFQGAADADYFYDVLGCRTLATIHDGSVYSEQLARVAEGRFKERGGEVVAAEAMAPTDVEVRPLLTRIATAKPCTLYFPIFVAGAGIVVRQARDVPGLEDTHIIGSSALMAAGFLAGAGDAAVGVSFTNPDISSDAFGEGYVDFVKKYEEKYGEKPIQSFHANSYDATAISLMAIEKVVKTDDDGNSYIGRKALRDALFATKGYQGISGRIDCKESGDCTAGKFAVYQYTDSNPDSFNPGVNPKKIYPK